LVETLHTQLNSWAGLSVNACQFDLSKFILPRASENSGPIRDDFRECQSRVDPYSRMADDWLGAEAPGGTHPISPTANPRRNPMNSPQTHELIIVNSDCFILIVSR
jgi:hypothetical protein